MKKNILFFFLLIAMIGLCACSFENGGLIMPSDQKKANNNFEKVLEAIEEENKDLLISLFAKETLKKVVSFDSTIDDLFDYFNGDVISYNDWGGPVVEITREDDQIIQTMDSTYDVTTTECVYRFSLRYISRDTTNTDNLGVHFLYITKLEDDTSPEHAYWGDGKDTLGINIDKIMC